MTDTPKEPAQQPIRGVNLGGWLVLEKWMTPKLFAGTSAVDEYGLCMVDGAGIPERLRQHRETFITREDFAWLADHNIRKVRLPVGWWIFGNAAPYHGTVEYVDRAFGWAQEYGITILLDIHAVPGSQNGWDHSGRSGVCAWHTDEANIVRTLEVLKMLVQRYGAHTSLLGIELLNEPKWTIPRRKLLSYYEVGYRIVREGCGPDTWVVFHDSFRPRRWKRKLQAPEFTNMYIDTHQYQTFDRKDKKLDMAGHMKKTLVKIPKQLRKMQKYHPVIVGEWSLALDPLSMQGLDDAGREAAARAFGAAQLIAYDRMDAWFYWSYKTESGGIWSYRDCIEKGRLQPVEA